jgi:hypothetical protein
MLLLRRPVHDILHGEALLVRLRGDDAYAFRHKGHVITGMGGHRVPVSKHLEIGYGIAWIDGQRVKQTKAYHLFLS